jgi:hypothetical protein
MALDFQQVREQVKILGENAPLRARELQALRERAREILLSNAQDLERLTRKVQMIAHDYDPNLRCALPVSEALNESFALPGSLSEATILAADGSQIAPDRHAQVDYCLINVGAIQLRCDQVEAPEITVHSQLFYDEALYTESGTITDDQLALMRDLEERRMLAELAEKAQPPVIAFTDGPMELWGAKDANGPGGFTQSLQVYQSALSRLNELNVVAAGYVDKPAANLLVRLLEVAMTPEDQLVEIKKRYPLRGVTDKEILSNLLECGERSAVFAMQSKSAAQYRGDLGLHFFYLNVGRPGHPWLARVEIPAWVARNPQMLGDLHSALVEQCRILGSRPYPYLLHRAHEAAVVSLEEKEQVTQMIVMELRQRGVSVGDQSHKQAAKDLDGRTRYSG